MAERIFRPPFPWEGLPAVPPKDWNPFAKHQYRALPLDSIEDIRQSMIDSGVNKEIEKQKRILNAAR